MAFATKVDLAALAPLRGPALKFVATFAALTWVYSLAAASAVDAAVIDWTARSAAAILTAIDPSLHVTARGGSLVSPWAQLDIVHGCEGTDAFFLLVAALVAARLRWKQRVIGALIALPLVFIANQVRLVVLFFALRRSPDAFTLLHGLVLPLSVSAAVILWFWWFARQRSYSRLDSEFDQRTATAESVIR